MGIRVAGLALLAIIYGQLIWHDPLLQDWDDGYFIRIVGSVTSLQDYVHRLFAGHFSDLQPIRDLSFAADIWVSRAFNVSTFHLTNFVLWTLIVTTVDSIVRIARPSVSPTARGVFVLLFAIHPVFVNSVSWVGARKHLLAALFVFIATKHFLNGINGGSLRPAKIAVSYLFSVLSQPISALWPLWALLYSKAKRQQITGALRGSLYACFTIMCATLAINYWFYTEVYAARYVDKIVDYSLGYSLLAYGRYLMNLIYPFQIAVAYTPAPLLNLIGILAFPAVAYALFRILSAREFIAWFGYFLFPLVLVTAFSTNIFASDPYLLVPSLGALLICSGVYQRLRVAKSAKIALATTITAVFAAKSYQQAQLWHSERTLWRQAAQYDRHVEIMIRHAQHELNAGNTIAAISAALWAFEYDSEDPRYPALVTRAIVGDHILSTTEKAEILLRNRTKHPLFDIALERLVAGASFLDCISVGRVNCTSLGARFEPPLSCEKISR